MSTALCPFGVGDRVTYTGTMHRLATVRTPGDRGTVAAILPDGLVRVGWDVARVGDIDVSELSARHLAPVVRP